MHAGGLFHFKKDNPAYSIKPEDYGKLPLYAASSENRMLNEFVMYVLQDLHTGQGLSSLAVTSDEPQFVKEIFERVYPAIPATAVCDQLPETMAFSRQLIAYLAAFLPIAPYFRNADLRIAGISDDQYTTTLEMLNESTEDRYKTYISRKAQAWFRRWPRTGLVGAAAAPPAADPTIGEGGVGTATPARPPAPSLSDDEEYAELHTNDPPPSASPILPVETLDPGHPKGPGAA